MCMPSLHRLTDLHKSVQQQRMQNGVEDGVGGTAAEQVGGKRGDIVKLVRKCVCAGKGVRVCVLMSIVPVCHTPRDCLC